MTEQELKKELELYQGMYYTLLNAVTDVIEVTAFGCVKNHLQSAVYRAKDMLMCGEGASLTKKEGADLLRRVMNGMIAGEIPMDQQFFDMCINKVLELDDIDPPSNEVVNEGLAELREKFKEAERDFYNKTK